MAFFQNTCFKECNNIMVGKKLWITINLHEKQCLQVIAGNKKHSSKQVVPMTYTYGKKFFAAAAFDNLWDIFFKAELKTWNILWSVWVFFVLLEKRRQINTVYGKKN